MLFPDSDDDDGVPPLPLNVTVYAVCLANDAVIVVALVIVPLVDDQPVNVYVYDDVLAMGAAVTLEPLLKDSTLPDAE